MALFAVITLPSRLIHFFKNGYWALKCADKSRNFLFYVFILQMLLVISGLETNPGPFSGNESNLKFAVWNLDSLPARDYARVPLIEAFQTSYNFDIFGVCESKNMISMIMKGISRVKHTGMLCVWKVLKI